MTYSSLLLTQNINKLMREVNTKHAREFGRDALFDDSGGIMPGSGRFRLYTSRPFSERSEAAVVAEHLANSLRDTGLGQGGKLGGASARSHSVRSAVSSARAKGADLPGGAPPKLPKHRIGLVVGGGADRWAPGDGAPLPTTERVRRDQAMSTGRSIMSGVSTERATTARRMAELKDAYDAETRKREEAELRVKALKRELETMATGYGVYAEGIKVVKPLTTDRRRELAEHAVEQRQLDLEFERRRVLAIAERDKKSFMESLK